MVTRSPVCTVVGHVDHGKSSVLDSIRGTCIIKGEAGAITQAIGASVVPLDTVKDKCGKMLETLNLDFTIPGVLFIDTPGHAAFTNLRKRGGNLADIAVLVVDINEGFKPQTIEAMEILKSYKTPFIIAANKIDLIGGWRSSKGPIIQNIQGQSEAVIQKMDNQLYELVGKVYEYGMQAERFDRVEDFTKQVGIVPCSAETGEGIPEVLMMLAGLAQKYLNQKLVFDADGPCKGTILEVKDQKGIGKTLDVIIYDGKLSVNDTIVIGGLDEPIITKVKAIFSTSNLSELRDKKAKFKSAKEVHAATAVRVNAAGIETAVSGMPIRGVENDENIEQIKEEIQSEIDEVIMDTDDEGVVVKADSLGSLEAIISLLRERNVMIKKALVGNVTKKDISVAESNYYHDPLTSVILAFNVGIKSDVLIPDNVKVIRSEVVYQILEEYGNWYEKEKMRQEAKVMEKLTPIAKMQVMKGYVFRQSNPAVCGLDVLVGKIKTNMPVMKNGKVISYVKEIQENKKNVPEVGAGKQVATAFPKVTIGRQMDEEDFLYSAINEVEFGTYKKFKQFLSSEEISVLKEIAEIMRAENPLWGV